MGTLCGLGARGPGLGLGAHLTFRPRLLLGGDFSTVGDPDEGVIVLPVGGLPSAPLVRAPRLPIIPLAAVPADDAASSERMCVCGCGCGAMVRWRFLPGHDATLKSRLLRRQAEGDADASARMRELGWRPKVHTCATRTATVVMVSRRLLTSLISVVAALVAASGCSSEGSLNVAETTTPVISVAATIVQSSAGDVPTTEVASTAPVPAPTPDDDNATVRAVEAQSGSASVGPDQAVAVAATD